MIIILKYLKVYGNTIEINQPFSDDNSAIVDFPADDNNSTLFKFKAKIASRTGNDGTKNVKIMVLLKFLSNLWRTIETPLINCEFHLIRTWSANCFITDASINNQVLIFTITDTKLYVPLVNLSSQDNAKTIATNETRFEMNN